MKSLSFKTRFGWISAFEEKGKIVRIKFGKHKNKNISKNLKNLKLQINRFFSKKNSTIKSNFLIKGNFIQKKVWRELTKIKIGKTKSYGEIAKKFKISRIAQDEFALNSQKKTELAITKNRFNDELIKINANNNILDKDEHPRIGLKMSDLEKLKTVFQQNGTVTPGNSSGINDGAAALLLTSLEEAKKKSIQPLAKIVSWATVGVDPALMGLGPIEAVRQATKKARWNLDEIDLFEINEAFAAQTIAVIRELGIDQNKVNVNGGAIALGHPIGASGTRILVTLIHELKRQKKQKGCATLCIGGGMGIAMCVERV